MSATSVEQISLRSLDQSARSSRSYIPDSDTHDGEDEYTERPASIGQASRDIDEPPLVGSSGGYIDGGYGWVVTAGTSAPHFRLNELGAFTLLFLQLGTLYAWGVFQAELANQKLGNSVVLSSIGGVSGFCTALGCLPVSS